jgi:hypothetical protein
LQNIIKGGKFLSTWDEKFKGHAIHQAVGAVTEFVRGIDLTNLPLDVVDAISRIIIALEKATTLLETADATLISYQLLDTLNKHINAIKAELSAYITNHNVGHVTNANNNTDTLLDIMSRLLLVRTEADISAIINTASVFRETARNLMSTLTCESENTKKIIKENMDNVSALSTQVEQLRTNIDQQKPRLDTAITEFQRQFSEAEDRRRQTFEATTKKLADDISKTQLELKQSIEKFTSKTEDDAKKLVEEIDEKRKDAIELLHVIGNIGLTGNYKMEANSEKQSADVFRWISLAAMVLIVLGVGSTLWTALKPDALWQPVMLRIGITIALAIPAAYAARESERHRQLERHYRRMELELASVDTYLGKLPDNIKNDLKAKLADQFFGRTGIDTKTEQDKIVTTSILDILKLAIEKLAKK